MNDLMNPFHVLDNLIKSNQAVLDEIEKNPSLKEAYEKESKKLDDIEMNADRLLSYLVDQQPMQKREIGRDVLLPNQRIPNVMLRRAGNTNIPRLIKNLRRWQATVYGQAASRNQFGKDIGFSLRYKDPSYKPSKKEKEDLARWEVKLVDQFFFPAGEKEPSLPKFIGNMYEDFFDLDDITLQIFRNKLAEPYGIQIQDPTIWYYAVDRVKSVPMNFADDMLFDDNYNNLEVEKRRYDYIMYVENQKVKGADRDWLTKSHFFVRSDYQQMRKGYPIVEQAIEIVTTIVNAFNYNSSNFTRNRTPHGFAVLSGPGMSSPNTIEKIKKLLWASMSTAVDRHRLPVVGLEQGGDAKWLNIDSTPKDLEFYTGITLYATMIYGLSGTNPNESGIASFKDAMESGGLGRKDDTEVYKQSQDTGLRTFLCHVQDILNKPCSDGHNVFEQVTGMPVMVEFRGLVSEDLKLKTEIDKGRLETGVTPNEILIEEGRKPQEFMIGTGESQRNLFDLPFAAHTSLNQFIKGQIQADQQKEQMEQQMQIQQQMQAQQQGGEAGQQQEEAPELSEADRQMIDQYGSPE